MSRPAGKLPRLHPARAYQRGASGSPRGDFDFALEDLAGRALRQLVDEPDVTRVLVRGDLLLDERLELLGAHVGPLLQRDRRADLLTELVVRHADHRRLA